MMWLKTMFTSLVILPVVCNAAIFHDIDTTTSLLCTLSSTHQNRILVSEGRIAKVIFPEGSLAIQTEEESGQAFVCAGVREAEKTTITVVTENGFVQDLEVQFENRPSEVVVLREEKEKQVVEQLETWGEIKYLLQKILRGEVPQGFCRFDVRCQRCIGRSLRIDTIASFEGATETLYLYKVKNTTRRRALLDERLLVIPGSLWVYSKKNMLNPQEETLAVQAVKRNETER